jgi:hypothetical protein
MPSMRADYYRRQAEICLRLSLAVADEESCAELFGMAQRYKAKAEAMEREKDMAGVIARASSSDHEEQR